MLKHGRKCLSVELQVVDPFPVVDRHAEVYCGKGRYRSGGSDERCLGRRDGIPLPDLLQITTKGIDDLLNPRALLRKGGILFA